MTSEPGTGSDPAHSRVQAVQQKVKHEFQEWMVMFVYLWPKK